MAILIRKKKDQKRKDEYNRSFAKAKKANKGKIPANFPTYANWKKQLYDKYETKPKKRVRLKPKKKIATTRTKATEKELRKNLSYKEVMRLRGRGR